MRNIVDGRAIIYGTCVVPACGISPRFRAAAHCEHLIIELKTYLSKRAKLVFLSVFLLSYEGWYEKTLPNNFDTHRATEPSR